MICSTYFDSVPSLTHSLETTHQTHTQNVPKIAHRRTSPGNAQRSSDLHCETSNKNHAHHRAQKNKHVLVDQNIVLKLSKTGENELLTGEKGQA